MKNLRSRPPRSIGRLRREVRWHCCSSRATSKGRATAAIQQEKEPVVAQRVIQEVRVDEKFAFATAKIHWQAEKGDSLALLFEPAVLMRASYPSNSLKLVQAMIGSKRGQRLVAEKSGAFDIEVQY